jgi:glycosyltransferase involved in cell wall biosynthesis
MKIAYVFSTLAKNGGTERMITEKANYFADKFGYEVTIINIFQPEEETNRYLLSEKVKQINLGIPYYFQYNYKYPKILGVKWQINKQIKRAIKQYVQKVDPDILIAISFFKANLICTVNCRAKKVIECHEAKPFTHSNFSRKQIIISKIYKKIWRFFYFRTIEQNADAIFTLTEEDKKLWKKAKYIEVIPNFSSMTITKYSDCSSKRVIAVGRLEWEKGFDRLIEAWSIVFSRHNDWHLDIFGEGSMYDTLINLSHLFKAKNITIHPVTSNISQEYANSSICVVSSYFEGFSLVLLEAMRHGVPCIAYDCPFGPRNIISDAYNGFLVENGDTRLFAERICRLIEDEKLRNYFSKTSIEKANSYNKEVIMNKWKSIFEQITSQQI